MHIYNKPGERPGIAINFARVDFGKEGARLCPARSMSDLQVPAACDRVETFALLSTYSLPAPVPITETMFSRSP